MIVIPVGCCVTQYDMLGACFIMIVIPSVFHYDCNTNSKISANGTDNSDNEEYNKNKD